MVKHYSPSGLCRGLGVVGGGYKNIFFTNNIQYSKKQISILGLESPHSVSAYIN